MNLCLYFFFIFFPFINPSEADLLILRKGIIEIYNKHEAEKLMGCKSYTFNITEDGFVRYKRILKNNKTEYYSVKINKVQHVNYLGNNKGGWIILVCEPSSVIYQTYRDPAGDIDSMVKDISFPFQSVSAEELTRLEENFKKMKTSYSNTVE